MVKHIIGDVHLDKRLYETRPQWRGVVRNQIHAAFSTVLGVKSGVRIFAGDFFNHYSVSEDALKLAINRLSADPDTLNLILGGNHDSTKIYSRISSLDVLAELPNVRVVNAFEPERIELRDGTEVLMIPHMKSQEAFEEACKYARAVDIAVLHCTYGDRPPYVQSTNDLFLSPELADELAERHGHVFMGHIHRYREILPNLIQLGAICPQGPRELGDHLTLTLEDDKIRRHGFVPGSPVWRRYEYKYEDVTGFVKKLQSLDSDVSFVYVSGIAQEQVKAAKIAYDVFASDSKNIVQCFFDAEASEDISDIKYYDMSFNVRTELNLFAEETNMSSAQYTRMDGYLNAALRSEDDEDADD